MLTPAEQLEQDLEKLETQLRGIRLLLDRQYIHPFVRMTPWEVDGVKLDFY